MTLLRLRPFLALSAVVALGACERHDWEDTKVLFKHHGGEHADHGEGHGDHGDGHAEKHDTEKAHAEPEKH